jgi:6-phosphogluconolactonase (cycloisomerase 2 family)
VEQNGSHPHQVLRWPGTDLFIAPDKGLDRIHVVRLDNAGRIRTTDDVVVRSGAGPRHAAFDPEHSRLWVCNELDSTVTTYGIDVAAGRLQPQHVASLLPGHFTGESRAAGIVAHSRSHVVYVSNRGLDAVTVLHVDKATGSLVARQWASSLGKTPRFLTLTPDESHLVVANEGSDTLVRYRVAVDGSLGEGKIVAATGSPVCAVFLSR